MMPRRAAAHPLPMPEFLPPAPRGGPLAALWLGTALACLTVAAIDAADAWQQREDARDRLRAAERQAAAQRPAPPPARSGLAAGRAPAEAGAATARAAAERALHHPWEAVFTAVEVATGPQVHWLRLDHGDRDTLRLEGSAPGLDAALATAERLRRHGGWTDVVLARVTPPDSAAGAVDADPAVPFELTARRAGGRP